MSEHNLETLATEFAKARDNLTAAADEVKGRMEKGEKHIESVKETADEALLKYGELAAQIKEMQQKAARRGGGDEAVQSLGAQLSALPEFKEFHASPSAGKAARLNIKATITSLTTDADGSAGKLVQPQLLPGVQALYQRPLAIRDLLAQGTTDSNAVTYIRETGFTNAAAFVDEGQPMPYSDLKFSDETVSVKTVGHMMKASRQILDDAAMLESTINQRLIYGLKEVEDRQLLNGDGSGNNLKGILPQATPFADPAELAQYSLIDQIRLAVLQAVIAGYPADGIVMNPIDWAKIELQKDTVGRHIIGNPQGSATPVLWRLPVVETTAIAGGTFLTGSFKMAAQIFDRQNVSVEVATENSDDFEKNLISIRCTERLALAVYRPEAFIKGTLAAKG